MLYATGLASGRFLVIVAVLVCWLSAFPVFVDAQGTLSQNAICSSSSGCSTTVGSPAFIDASMLLPPNSTTLGRDLCDAIYRLLTGFTGFPPYPSTGAVIDARGITGATNLTCTHGSPWTESTSVSVPSTILLPAGTIVIPTTWVLPNNTTLIGVGDNLPASTSAASSTTIQACKNTCSFTGSDMIDFGSPVLCAPMCNSVSVENLTLDGQGQTINGIVNANSQTGSYVDHVSLYQILGTGLLVESNANNSGPYSNITFDTGGYSGAPSTVCARGWHSPFSAPPMNGAPYPFRALCGRVGRQTHGPRIESGFLLDYELGNKIT
jgi:hypothetical protein